jgi:hypothetical protein
MARVIQELVTDPLVEVSVPTLEVNMLEVVEGEPLLSGGLPAAPSLSVVAPLDVLDVIGPESRVDVAEGESLSSDALGAPSLLVVWYRSPSCRYPVLEIARQFSARVLPPFLIPLTKVFLLTFRTDL